MHFLDATFQEETAVPLRMHVVYAFPGGTPVLHAVRIVGSETLDMAQTKSLLKHAEKYACSMWTGLETKLRDEEARRGAKARERFLAGRR